MSLAELIEVSRRYGSDPRFVLAGGGNTSVKESDALWVKASGTSLAEASEAAFVPMDLQALLELGERDLGQEPDERERRYKEALYAARLHGSNLRPSVECLLHALIPHRLVVHTHSTVANWVTCCDRGEEIARQLGAVWVPYVDPGFTLALALKRAVREAGRSDVILMENHGLIVSGETAGEIEEKTRALLGQLDREFEWPSGDAGALPLGPWLRGLLRQVTATWRNSGPALWWAEHGDPEIGPLTPDQIVYCKSFPLWIEPETDLQALKTKLEEHRRKTGFAPKVVVVRGRGLFGLGATLGDATTAADVYEDAIRVARGAAEFGRVQPMSQRDREFIDAWEVEQYRRQVAQSGSNGRVQGKVALVTGAAQGFGLGLAEGLIREGAQVVFADLNAGGAETAAATLDPKNSRGIRIDVSDKESVRAAVEATVATYGGIDLLVSNAGVLRAESVLTQAEGDFDLTTDVNYKGYFLCVQAVAPVMRAQHEARPGAMSDIVQINSKSGLSGSNRNFAYAGSKFGAIGLTQSFALELIEYGIKVNSICPGNFFDGPLWSDPERGLFAQYLRTGKVPGAKTLEDVKRAYEAKVPMGRGCTPQDVLRALLYAVEQEYETGQAIPVTGGQEMLR